MKKLLAVVLTLAMCCAFTACGKDEATEETYEGVLTKVRLGMPMNKVIQLNSGCEMYYETESQIWCVNNDTDLAELKDKIQEGEQFFHVDDSLITYNFKHKDGDEEYYLEGYLEEIPCLLPREIADEYYMSKVKRLAAKYGFNEEEIVVKQKGTEDIDLTLYYTSVMTLPSFEVTFKMEQTYDNVDAVDGYYANYFSVELKELANKAEIEVATDEKKK